VLNDKQITFLKINLAVGEHKSLIGSGGAPIFLGRISHMIEWKPVVRSSSPQELFSLLSTGALLLLFNKWFPLNIMCDMIHSQV